MIMSYRARDSYDSYHPRNHNPSSRPPGRPQQARSGGDGDMYRFGGQSRTRSEFSFRSRISQRDLLTHVPSSFETPVLSQNHASNKFRDVENLTDSEEEEMSEDEESEEHTRSKKRRIVTDDVATEPLAKWSNPDPYTALPPAPDSAHKRVDVVRLIRKARNETGSGPSTEADQADFISFDKLGDDDLLAPPSNAPTGPRADPASHTREESRPSKVLGKRKHEAFEDDILMGPADRTRFHKSGKVLAAWQSREGSLGTPWLKSCCTHDSPMTALHKEVLDFYNWVRPKDFEKAMRQDLVNRLSKELRRWRPGGKLEAFGSYAAGLYLPTGDMDLVYNYSTPSSFGSSKSDVRNVARFLQNTNLPRPRSLIPIPKAKVPIVKYVDNLTGLKVDLSFNNKTGIVANETFQKWQATHPAVAIIVAVIKQFLMIRGLNDNASGGLGGFATICMVTSLVQNMPSHKDHLGELLVEFFNLYGNLLNAQDVGIRMEPPGYISKKHHKFMCNEKAERLVIIDPNQPDNNITGGSSEYRRILSLFSKTHEVILSRLEDFAGRDKTNGHFSFLADVVGGDFSAYEAQRAALSLIFKRDHNGTVVDEPIRSLPPPQQTAPPSSLPLPTEAVASAGLAKGVTRLAKLRELFPELAGKLAKYKSIGPNQAVSLGGWTSRPAMNKDISARESQKIASTQKVVSAKKARSRSKAQSA